jgi:glycosyltransferase involved in cell wall biosynthesis
MWVANIKSAKRPELYIDLARQFASDPHTRFLMVGAIQDRRYSSLLDSTSSLPNFQYLGKQSLEDVNRLLETAHVFVNTSRLDGEGFPNSFIQAWLREVPVVSLDVDVDDYLAKHALGRHCGGDLAVMTNEIRSLLYDAERLQSIGKAAREFAIEAFGEKKFRQLVDLLENTPSSLAHNPESGSKLLA